MVSIPETNQQPLSAHDLEELTKLVNAVALSEKSRTLFAIAPDSGPSHPVTEAFAAQLKQTLDEPLQFQTFFYSDNSLFNFLATLDAQAPLEAGRRIVFAFGLDQLPKPRLKQELEQLNLGREKIFEQNLVLVFWLNQERFLDEFRDRAPDFWDWRGQVALFEHRHPFLYPYLEWLIAEHSYLTMSGIMQVNRQVDIFLDQIYVSLQAERRQQVTVTSNRQQASKVSGQHQFGRRSKLADLELNFTSEPVLEMKRTELEVDTSSTKTVIEKVDLADVVRDSYACSVILGAPGAGKTTLLKHLALQFAKALRDNQDTVHGGTKQESLGQPRWPIYLRIADYAERLERHPELSVVDYLKRFYRGWEDHFDSGDASDLVTPLQNRMEQGQCLILLDGLDEVFDQNSRRKIVGCINQFAEEFSHNKLIVTSRIAGYQEVKLASRFTEFTITDMTDDQVSEFLHRWCRAVEQAQKSEATPEQQERAGDQQAEQILSDIKRNEGVRRLTANPLLLTILALIHRNGERLPERRVKLYELAVQTLTADWQLSKKLPNAQKVLLPEGEVVELLAPLAYWMHEEKPSGQVTHGEVVKQLAPRLAELRGEEPDSPDIVAAVGEFLRRVRETTGLFVEQAPNVYGFMHLTFEEYFAARDIADKDRSEILETIRSHWLEPRWAEPTLLALGYYGDHSPRLLNRLIEQLFEPLSAYQPQIGRDTVKLRGSDSQKAKLLWTKADGSEGDEQFSLQELLFAGQAIAQVAEVNVNARKKLIARLLETALILADDPDDAEESVVKQILQLLRQIEQFHQQGEVVKALQTIIEDTEISKEIRLKAQAAKLYVLCGETGSGLAECATELAETMEPDLFCALRELVDGLGAEMNPALESIRHQPKFSEKQQALTFITAMTYTRTAYHQKAIELFGELTNAENSSLNPYVAWSMAICHGEEWNYDKADNFYQSCYESLTECAEYWKDRGKFQQSNAKYEKALDCFQQMLAITDALQNLQKKALAFDYLGKVYKASGKYEDAIHCHEQSRDLYLQLERESNVADQWSHIADCYSKWKRHEQALASQQKALGICQKRIDQSAVSLSYRQLGDIYQAWDKYEEAICYYEQSRNLYQQLGKFSDVANQWFYIAKCNCKWGRYEQALFDYQQALVINYEYNGTVSSWTGLMLSNICKADGKYREAIHFHEQIRDFCQKLNQESNVANQWRNIADCYLEWEHYEQALASQQQALVIHQKLDDESAIALTYNQLGRIYQAWDKYEEAIRYHEQSRDLYQQLEKESNVANQWSNLAMCYREWGRREQALASQQQALVIRQKLDDESAIALTY
ncbi:tetratricopeptide repeat protein, partial [Adonisia turfae]|uniref:tetratricopeptide repeat protein n=1 Tax=Adonisia turfae TaxID=2950184 RepID=UPI002029991D